MVAARDPLVGSLCVELRSVGTRGNAALVYCRGGRTLSPRAKSSRVAVLLGERWPGTPLSSGTTVFCPVGWKTRLDWAVKDRDWRPPPSVTGFSWCCGSLRCSDTPLTRSSALRPSGRERSSSRRYVRENPRSPDTRAPLLTADTTLICSRGSVPGKSERNHT